MSDDERPNTALAFLFLTVAIVGLLIAYAIIQKKEQDKQQGPGPTITATLTTT